MSVSAVTQKQFVEIWNRHQGCARDVAKEIGVTDRNVLDRRRRIEKELGEPLVAFKRSTAVLETVKGWSRRINLDIEHGSVVVFSDAHYLPGPASRAHRGMLKLIAQVKPVAVIANGDILDGVSISRHPPLGWTGPKVKVADEVKAVGERMNEIAEVARKAYRNVKLRRTRGNHDNRFDTYLAANASQFEGVPGFSLADHLVDWPDSMSIMVNDGKPGVIPTMIKHRWHNGLHATYNNLMKGGVHIVTGHLHRLKEERWGDYRGRRYSVDTGTLAEIDHEEFEYTEDNAVPWGSGFAVLTYHNHHLLPPELAEVMEPGLVFRGRILEI